MSTLELKNKLHHLISDTEDAALLEEVLKVLTYKQSQEDWWEEIPHALQQRIKKSASQADAGNLIPHSEVRERINNLLYKNE